MPDQAGSVYSQIQLWAAYDAIPVTGLAGNWAVGYLPKDGSNFFMQRNRAEFGVEKDGWQVGIEYRQEGMLEASRNTLDLYRLYQGRMRPATMQEFKLNAQFSSWSSAGLRVARTFALGGASNADLLLKVSGVLYADPRTQESNLTGNVNYRDTDAYVFNAQYNESSTRYRYPLMPDLSPNSSGASVSLALQWVLSERLKTSLTINDIWSRMQWSNLPTVTKYINSDVTSYDKDGYINYQPLLFGQNSQVKKMNRIGASETIGFTYQMDQWRVRAGVDRVKGVTIPAIALTRHSAWGAWTTSYESRFRTVGIGYENGLFRLNLRSNRWSLSEASAFGLDAGVRYVF